MTTRKCSRLPRPRLQALPVVACLATLPFFGVSWAQTTAQQPAATATAGQAATTGQAAPTGQATAPQASAEQAAAASTIQDEKNQTAVPVGLSEPMGPATDPFNDTRTLGYVIGGYRFVPDVNVARFHETNPRKVPENAPSDRATVFYTTITISDAKGGPRRLFAGAAQTRWDNINTGSDARRSVRYEDRFSLAGWRLPVRLGYYSDVVSRSSFLNRGDSEVKVESKTAGVDAVRSFGGTRVAFALRAADVDIGAAMAGRQNSNSNTNVLLRGRLTQALNASVAVYGSLQTQGYDYATSAFQAVNPTSRVNVATLGVQWQATPALGLSADLGNSDKRSGRPDLVPEARHPVGSFKVGFDPSDRTNMYLAYVRDVEELNDRGLSNLEIRALSLGLGHRFTSTLATTMSYDWTDIRTNELSGKGVDTKFFATLLWKPHRQVLTAIAFSRTQRKVYDLGGLVRPFTNDRYLVNVTYYF